ncbi:response regulator [Alkalibaculum sp. M08DMB]|uniref:Stage 0 sporulation protein A homolog n=1 Tax=Alkalibaculum sporogenes TaxID=2655001 RepID=A0A6A7K5Z7_9FIRM|nr:LytTR family DNA-binding domain-containing protein [Alkalibaculum sporogenes]MPW24573.1 response regulator [Alkalibaculum sporogenes]
MTYRLAVCDDQESIVLTLKKYIQEISYEEGFEIQIDIYDNPIELLKKFQDDPFIYNLIFLDVDMPEMNGLDVGARIKDVNEYAITVFVTAHDKYALKAFEVGAFNYIVKPINKEKLRDTLGKSLRLITKLSIDEQSMYITIYDKGKYIKILYKDILYFEKHGNKIIITCEDCEYESYLTFKKLKELLGNQFFVQCHRGAIVHKEKIIRLENNMVIMDKNHKIPVSKNYLNDIKETFFEYLREGE